MSRTPAKENVGLTYNGVDLRAHLNSVSMEDVVEVIESMTFASTAIEKGPGAPSFKISVGGPWSKTLHQAIAPDTLNPPTTLRTLVYYIGPSGSRVTRTWTGSATVGAFVSNYKPDATDPKGDIVWTGTLELSGLPVES
ncbi:MAG: hypothetical protein KDE24_00200 [Caldilinea sp.]|nr:hypothetical protein [Caldilinea sp.]